MEIDWVIPTISFFIGFSFTSSTLYLYKRMKFYRIQYELIRIKYNHLKDAWYREKGLY